MTKPRSTIEGEERISVRDASPIFLYQPLCQPTSSSLITTLITSPNRYWGKRLTQIVPIILPPVPRSDFSTSEAQSCPLRPLPHSPRQSSLDAPHGLPGVRVIYRQGSKHVNADALSRLVTSEDEGFTVNMACPASVSTTTTQSWCHGRGSLCQTQARRTPCPVDGRPHLHQAGQSRSGRLPPHNQTKLSHRNAGPSTSNEPFPASLSP